MPDEGMSLGELSRRVAEALVRFESLARRLEEGQFVRTDLYLEFRSGLGRDLKSITDRLQAVETTKVDKTIEERIKKLEEANTWLVRLILGFVVLGVLGAVFAASGGLPK